MELLNPLHITTVCCVLSALAAAGSAIIACILAWRVRYWQRRYAEAKAKNDAFEESWLRLKSFKPKSDPHAYLFPIEQMPDGALPIYDADYPEPEDDDDA